MNQQDQKRSEESARALGPVARIRLRHGRRTDGPFCVMCRWPDGSLVDWPCPDWHDADSAYRAGREDAAREIENAPDPKYVNASDSWWSGYEEAKQDAVEIARGSSGSDERRDSNG